jgi:hypothetical protein
MPDSRVRRLSVRTASVQDYFKSGCERQPSPSARETRPPDPNHEGASFASCAATSRVGQGGWCRVVSGSEPRGRWSPRLADRIGQKSLRVSPREGAGFRVGWSRWTGHDPKSEAWGSAPLARSRPVANGDPRGDASARAEGCVLAVDPASGDHAPGARDPPAQERRQRCGRQPLRRAGIGLEAQVEVGSGGHSSTRRAPNWRTAVLRVRSVASSRRPNPCVCV